MAHKVTFDLPTRELGKADVHFLVKRDGVVLGKLEVSKGSVVWYPKNTRYGHKIRWDALNAMAVNYPRVERRKSR
ncbi:MAG TPA: hypothetical protein VHC20_03155 [Candidatus Paceibacterota bacterium]|nr:hypothetical protein [Candidatus Paceibacterota bacterium]